MRTVALGSAAREGSVATYIVSELTKRGPAREAPIEGFTVAKLVAQKRARASEHPVVIRDSQTGRELARYLPRKNTARAELDGVLDKLAHATERMEGILQRKGQKREPER